MKYMHARKITLTHKNIFGINFNLICLNKKVSQNLNFIPKHFESKVIRQIPIFFF